ncbi:hypothetical protein [Paenibacillus wenxiniae]|uniref:SMI1/KNR4 family protein n=1 Tax=Paenibacillus wenxiniae TaxID=1636843 RepID=A0ABW4RIL3_9BACL
MNQLTLQDAASAFVQQHQLYNEKYGLFKGNGIVALTEAASFQSDERIPLSAELTYWYSHYEMIDPKEPGANPRKNAAVLIGDGILLFFAAPEDLYDLQLGRRWVGMGDPDQLQESENWRAEYVVIATFNDDPVIADTSAPGTPIYVAYDTGKPALAAASLAEFFAALTILIEAATALDGEIQDEDTFEVKPQYMEAIEPKLNELLGEPATHQLLLYLSLRWES